MNDAPEVEGQSAPNLDQHAAPEWIDAATVAQRLGVSLRAVQKRCQSGKIEALSVEGENGPKWEISAAAVEVWARTKGTTNRREPPRTSGTNYHEPAPRTTANFASKSEEPSVKSTTNHHERTTANRDELSPRTTTNHRELRADEEAERLRAEIERERREREQDREEIRFLRGLVEQHQRSEAELRASLREALKAMPKQLNEGAGVLSTKAPLNGIEEAMPASNNTAQGDMTEQTQKSAAQQKEPRPLWKLILGVR